jgi:4-hydroxy-tetrahydrodipicolinate reductase
MQVRVIVTGARGKMGTIAVETIRQHPQFTLVAALGSGDSLQHSIVDKKAQIVIDLTRADCVYENALTIIDSGVHPVIGTTGLREDELTILRNRCAEQQLGGIIVPNFSLGAVLMMRFAAMAARFLPEVEIIEMHHQQKLDAPSGTALKTAEMIHAARRSTKQALSLKELIPGARGGTHHDVNIHSLRLPGVLARQTVVFGNVGETLTITHDSIDRRCFMPGLILACQRVMDLDHLYYGLEHLLED